MGKYINYTSNGSPLPSRGKAEFLVENENAMEIPVPLDWKEGLVCVVENGLFDAAAYCYSPEEMTVFKDQDGRPRTWLYLPNAKELSY